MKNVESVNVQLQDIRSIEQVVVDSERFQSNPEKFSQLLTADVVLINVAGIRLIGREEVYQALKNAMTTSLANIITRNEVGYITFLRPDVALMSGIKHIPMRSEDSLVAADTARLTLVLVKDQDKWLIAAIQNTPILS